MRRSPMPPVASGVPPQLRDWLRRYVEPSARKTADTEHTFGGTANVAERVRHRLGRVPDGFTVTDQDKAGTVYRDAATPKADRFVIWLKCSAASVKVRLDIF